MKYLLFLPFLAVLFFVSGCKKDETVTTPTTNTSTSQEFVATVDGTQWTANVVSTQTIQGLRSFVGTNITTASTISITLPASVTKGDYNLGTLTGIDRIATLSIGSEGYSTIATSLTDVVSGKVTITDVTSSQIKGTFNFVAKDATGSSSKTKTVTNGRFAVNL